MIELQSDELRISFPSIQKELKQLTAEYVESVARAICSEDRATAWTSFLQTSFPAQRLSPSEQKLKLDRLNGLDENAIRNALESEVNKSSRSKADCRIAFHRTLRLPDDGRTHSLPAGFGLFPLRHVDDHADHVPKSWIDRGGVMMPMYQSEALWMHFPSTYPFALKIGAGKVCAITGERWQNGLRQDPQDYVVLPDQPWLDGFAVSEGTVRQFVATPLGERSTVEEQITQRAETGGIQLQVYPMRAQHYFDTTVRPKLPKSLSDLLERLLEIPEVESLYCQRSSLLFASLSSTEMGLGAGGKMRQEIYEDTHNLESWDTEQTSRCFVHICNALEWREITGSNPPHPPLTAREYKDMNVPWFDYYRSDLKALKGSKVLAGVKSMGAIQQEKTGNAPFADPSIKTGEVVHCGPEKRPFQVREWAD